jgi:hypothetical protein
VNLPKKLPERGPFSRLYGWLNELRDYVESISPRAGQNTRVTHTRAGAVIDSGPRSTPVAAEQPRVAKWG